jgi:2-polyprenyl-3-methyl-5-hydroxy-6-metoxy-1,4-benzoquinol methylase
MHERIYSNQGNPPLVGLLGGECRSLLDVGCGAGDNAALLRARHPSCRVFGVTRAEGEAERARRFMERCWVFDIEAGFPEDLTAQRFDALMFSHVLEHVRQPAEVLARFIPLLNPGGVVLIAVPNVLSWRQRVQFLRGHFEYAESGVLDDTHLRFFTYFTAARYLLARSPELELKSEQVTGSVPLWWLRRHVFRADWSRAIDDWACGIWPNLFGGQILLEAIKK